MHNPPHPGETLREDVLPALKMTVTDTAAALGVLACRCLVCTGQLGSRLRWHFGMKGGLDQCRLQREHLHRTYVVL